MVCGTFTYSNVFTVSGNMIIGMGLESKSMLMEESMMVIGKMIIGMENEFLSMLVEKRLMVCGIMMNCCLHRYDNSICEFSIN